jgi:hypothetical protein
MALAQALLYLAAVAVLLFGWVRTVAGKPIYGAGYLAAACALLAYALPLIYARLGGHG